MKKQFIALLIMLTVESATIFSANFQINDGLSEDTHDRKIQQIEIKQPINQLPLNESTNHTPLNESIIDKQKHLGAETTKNVINAFRNDYEANVKSLINSRSFFGYAAGIAECLGNTCMYAGMGLSTISSAIALIGSRQSSEILIFSSTACFAAHVALIGIARCGERERSEREKLLVKLAKEVEFGVVPLQQIIVDDENGDPNLQNIKKQESLAMKKSLI